MLGRIERIPLHCPMISKKWRDFQFERQGEGQTRQLDDQVLDVTMEASFIQLVPPVMVDG